MWNSIGNKLSKWLLRKQTMHYRPQQSHYFRQLRDLPPLTWYWVEQMLATPEIRLGLRMRAAPVIGAEFAYKAGKQWVPGIQASSPEVSKWALRQMERLWRGDMIKLLESQTYGWSAGEVCYRMDRDFGTIEIEGLMIRHALDCLALERDGELAGVRFKNCPGVGQVDLPFPKSVWHVYDPVGESPYGYPVLRGAFSPWMDAYGNGGGHDVRRLFMHKDAYGGMRIGYPPDAMNVAGKGETPNANIAREIAEQRKSGGVITYPLIVKDGAKQWEIEEAQVASNPAHILQYPKDLKTEIFNGLDIPDDVLTSEEGGAWKGKQVPMQAFYCGLNLWANRLLRHWVEQVLLPTARYNFGKDVRLQVTIKPLDEQAMDKQTSGNVLAPSSLMPRPEQERQSPAMNPQRMSAGLESARALLEQARKARNDAA